LQEEAFLIGKDSFYKGFPYFKYKVIDYNDLILSKIKVSRPKELLDIQELERLKEKNPNFLRSRYCIKVNQFKTFDYFCHRYNFLI
jgi:hypothetical protein